MQKQVTTFLSIFFIAVQSFAQHYDNWYFGRKAALNFKVNGTTPVPKALTNSALISDEATGSISDDSGNLLFYTNGTTVYNKLHQVMLNGDNLPGHISSSQLCIVPWPGNDKLFFIFTTGSIESNFASGYQYSIVDMAGDNGNGQIISTNNMLWPSCTERLTAVRHANGTDLWIITNDNNSNIFRSWLITCTGLQSTAVVSAEGAVLDQFVTMNVGVMKVSPDGKLLCQTHFPFFDEILQLPNFTQIFDFDNATGVISNTRSIAFAGTQYTHGEFSPDSKLLYLTRPNQKKFDQFEITLPTIQAITASRVIFDTKGPFYSIQLAPDDKIYMAQPSQFLGAINNPNAKGTGCNFLDNKIDLSPGSSFLGLPSFINDVSASNPNNGISYTILDSCIGKVQFNGKSSMPGVLNWLWDFGDGSMPSAIQNPIHTFTPPDQLYSVKLIVTSSLSCGILHSTRVLFPKGIETDVDFDFTIRCDSGFVQFNNKSFSWVNGGGQFIWDFGDGTTSSVINPRHTYATPGNYSVKLKLVTGAACLSNSLILPLIIKPLTVTVTANQSILVGQSVTLFASAPTGSSYQWLPTTWLKNNNNSVIVATPLDDIVYKVTATTIDGCKSEDSVFIKVIQYEDVYVPSGFTPNQDGKNDDLIPYYHGKIDLQEFAVFNRWGQKIFSTSQRGSGWDGKVNGIVQNSGVYVWEVKITDTRNKNKQELKGTFVLIR